MAHDPSLGFADYFSAADATTVMPATMEEGAPELFGLQADMEYLGMRGLAAMPAAAHSSSHSKAVLIDAAGGGHHGSTNAATMRFLSDDDGQPQHHQQPMSQAPLSLSLCRPDDGGVGSGMTLHQHLGGASSRHHATAWTMHDYSSAAQPQPQQGAAWHLRSSRFLLPAQQLLQEFCSLPVDTKQQAAATTTKPSHQQEEGGGEGSSSSASWAPSPQIQAMDAVELQRLKDKLYIMLEEVDRRYRRYCEQMRALAGGFEAVAGDRAAAAYTALASRTISRHFRNLRDGIVAQLQAVRKALGEKDVAVPGMTRGETPRLRVLDQCIRQQKALNQAGMMETHPWRPQRGLPERAVTILRAWLFEHFLHPYPSDVDKHILARQTGLSRSQVSNWFINARVRLWKPMVEEMYVEEMKGEQLDNGGSGSSGGGGGQHSLLNPNNPSSSQASEAAYNNGRHHGGVGETTDSSHVGAHNNNRAVDRKPTRDQLLLHDAGSLAAVVNVGNRGPGGRLENFGVVMDHLDFDAYDGHQAAAAGFGGGAGVSLTLGLQQHADSQQQDSGVNIAFGAPQSAHHGAGYLFAAAGQQQMEGGHNVQFGAAMDGDATHGGQQEHYRSLNAGFHLLRDLAG